MDILSDVHGVVLPANPGPATESPWLLWEQGVGSTIIPVSAGETEDRNVLQGHVGGRQHETLACRLCPVSSAFCQGPLRPDLWAPSLWTLWTSHSPWSDATGSGLSAFPSCCFCPVPPSASRTFRAQLRCHFLCGALPGFLATGRLAE